MAVYEMYDENLVYTDQYGGAIYFEDDKQWYPFSYFDDGNIDIWEDGFNDAQSAYNASKKMFT